MRVLIALAIGLATATIPNTVAHCPDTCECDGQTVLCIGQSLKSLPEGLPLGTTELNLRDNDLETLDLDSLKNLHHLEGLDISKNKIKTTRGSFEYSSNLTSVHLSNNELETLSEGTFGRSLVWITYMSLYNNSWRCDCDMKWMVIEMESESSPFYARDIKCETPEELHGKFIYDQDVDKLVCKRKEGPGLQQKYIIMISVFAGIMGVFVTVAVAGYCIRRRRQGPLPLPIPASDDANAGNPVRKL
ncbi:hypothetical protein Bbelb_243040 [Branchiostoma belcheri]|nr:hypothetical protein Bbelb_243040 [Branchiostoma belcheri]